jgi:hypothetical protein
MKMKTCRKSQNSMSSLGVRATTLALALTGFIAVNVQAALITVDFDALNANSGPVSGAALDSYLAGFGITISNVVGPAGPSVYDATTPGAGFGFPNFMTPPSAPNFLWHPVSNNPIQYQLNFSTPLNSVSFTRVQINANLSPSGLVAATWSARALDSGGSTLDTVGESQFGSFGIIPAVVFTLNGPGITALVVERTSTNISAGMNSVPIDNLVIPEPATIGLLGLGALSLLRRKRKT